jgi:hypothetical protein
VKSKLLISVFVVSAASVSASPLLSKIVQAASPAAEVVVQHSKTAGAALAATGAWAYTQFTTAFEPALRNFEYPSTTLARQEKEIEALKKRLIPIEQAQSYATAKESEAYELRIENSKLQKRMDEVLQSSEVQIQSLKDELNTALNEAGGARKENTQLRNNAAALVQLGKFAENNANLETILALRSKVQELEKIIESKSADNEGSESSNGRLKKSSNRNSS